MLGLESPQVPTDHGALPGRIGPEAFEDIAERADKERTRQSVMATVWATIYYLIGGAAAVSAALAGAAGLAGDNAELAGILALVATALTALQTTFGEIRNPSAKVFKHRDLEQEFEGLRDLCREKALTVPFNDQATVKREWVRLSHRFRDLRLDALLLGGQPLGTATATDGTVLAHRRSHKKG